MSTSQLFASDPAGMTVPGLLQERARRTPAPKRETFQEFAPNG